ncbi:MAG: hypothetical protein LC115_13695 [Bacteroidia bacterium]|nr:hypothetical protein [Bacteroidia bacterium]
MSEDENKAGSSKLIAVISLILAIAVFIFGDNLYQQVTGHPFFSPNTNDSSTPISVFTETQVLPTSPNISTIPTSTNPPIPTPNYEIVFLKDFENGNLSDFNIANPSIARIVETNKTGKGVAIKKLDDKENFYIATVLPQQAKTGEVYKVRVQCKAPIGFFCRTFLGDVIGDSGKQYENNVSISVQGTGDWIEIETGILIMKNDDFLSVYIYGDNDQIEVIYDNLTVIKLP